MRAAALLVILAISATILAGARCAVACVRPAPPPCHHSPEKAPPVCDSNYVIGEKRSAATVEAPSAAPVVAVVDFAAPAQSDAPTDPGRQPRRYPPGETAPLILRI